MSELLSKAATSHARQATEQLARKLGLFDTTMLLMGGIIGSSIFVLPAAVAKQLPNPLAALAVWVLGGIITLFGAFIHAELSTRLPYVGGQYVYLREAYHPTIAFLYGWTLLLVTQTGAIASVAVIFARYFLATTHLTIAQGMVTTLVIALLSLVNCFGVRPGSTVQNILMTLKIITFLMLILCGLLLPARTYGVLGAADTGAPLTFDLLTAFGGTLLLVLFSYGGCQRVGFIAGEVANPRRNLPRGIVLGFCGVISVYVLVNFICLHALGVDSLARTPTPVSEVMRLALGERGALLIGAGVAVSAIGWLSQVMLTAPRVYFAMASDQLFFKSVAWLHPRTKAPVIAIALQGFCAIIIALLGKYEQILGYVMSADLIFFALTAGSIFLFRRRDSKAAASGAASRARDTNFKVPGHPFTTLVIIMVAVVVSLSQFYRSPVNSLIGLSIIFAGIPAYLWWRRRQTVQSIG